MKVLGLGAWMQNEFRVWGLGLASLISGIRV